MLDEELLKEKQRLETIIECVSKRLEGAPEGTLRIAQKKYGPQYYIRRDPKDPKGSYISRESMGLVCALAQKDYDKKILMEARREMTALNRLMDVREPRASRDVLTVVGERAGTQNQETASISASEGVGKMPTVKDPLLAVYERLHPLRRELIEAVAIPDKEYAEGWQNMEYEGKPFTIGSPELYTSKGERVRSKSEVIIANGLLMAKIPYRYEQPLWLDPLGPIHPDFTVLNKRTRREYYWEHMGMMDNPEYCKNALRRIDVYQQHGIYPGEGLILTYETAVSPLSAKTVERIIGHYLI